MNLWSLVTKLLFRGLLENIIKKKNPRARHGGFMLGNTLCRYSSCGKTKFKTTANSAVGATAEVASVFQIPGRY